MNIVFLLVLGFHSLFLLSYFIYSVFGYCTVMLPIKSDITEMHLFVKISYLLVCTFFVTWTYYMCWFP